VWHSEAHADPRVVGWLLLVVVSWRRISSLKMKWEEGSEAEASKYRRKRDRVGSTALKKTTR
jgi:hypothetical protein